MITAGTPIPGWEMESVSPEKMKTYAAVLRDPNPIHWDRAEVSARGFGDRLINQGPTNLGYVMNMLIAWAGPDSIRRITVRFTSEVFELDRVTTGGVVTAVRQADGVTLADCDVWLERGDGTRAVAGTATIALP